MQNTTLPRHMFEMLKSFAGISCRCSTFEVSGLCIINHATVWPAHVICKVNYGGGKHVLFMVVLVKGLLCALRIDTVRSGTNLQDNQRKPGAVYQIYLRSKFRLNILILILIITGIAVAGHSLHLTELLRI